MRVLLMLLLMGVAGVNSLAQPAPDPVQTGPGHLFACTDYTAGKVFLVSEEGRVLWSYDSGTCNDLWVLPNGNLLFNTGKGVREVNRAKETVFSFESASEIFACQRLANGNTFIGECNGGRLLEVEPSGKIAAELRLLPQGADGGHVYMRNARKLENGHYLVAHYGAQKVVEYDVQGAVLREMAAPGGPHSAIRLDNGNTLIACGDLQGAATVFEVDPAGATVWSVGPKELPGIELRFMSGLHRLRNGNTVMSNWLGHGHLGTGPHLIEVSPDKKVVWTFQDHRTMKTISSVQILDAAEDPAARTPQH